MASFLVPPNSFLLSEAVIGGVMQRVDPLYVNDSRKRLPSIQSITSITSESTKKLSKTKAKRQLKVPASRRERCRINQARYRKRQRQHTDDLESSLEQLQQEIQQLESTRRNIVRSSATDQSVWVVVTEYFRHFSHGYVPALFEPDSPREHVQLEFLKANFAADVTDGLLCGAEAILKHWELFTRYHGDVKVQLKRLDQVTSDALLAAVMISFTVTENTLQQFYPHLNEELAGKLLNQRITAAGSVRFDWDETTGRVVRLESKLDLLTPMLELLGSLENVATLFNHAWISPDGRFEGL